MTTTEKNIILASSDSGPVYVNTKTVFVREKFCWHANIATENWSVILLDNVISGQPGALLYFIRYQAGRIFWEVQFSWLSLGALDACCWYKQAHTLTMAPLTVMYACKWWEGGAGGRWRLWRFIAMNILAAATRKGPSIIRGGRRP